MVCLHLVVRTVVQNDSIKNRTLLHYSQVQKPWRQQLHDEPLPRVSVDILFCYHDSHSHLWMITTDCDHHNWPVLILCVTICDHLWWTDNDDHLFGKSFFKQFVTFSSNILFSFSFKHPKLRKFSKISSRIKKFFHETFLKSILEFPLYS